MIEVGIKAPAFTLPSGSGGNVSLKDFKGKNVVLYFYPKDNTPGCTTEACDFRDNFSRITAAGAVVLGVSADSPERHRKFSEKLELPFELLSDEDHVVLEKYSVWQEKKLYGRVFMGIVRGTVIIDAKGTTAAVFPKVTVKGHVDEVLEVLAELQ